MRALPRCCCACYPASFRSEYGEEMRAIFARRRRDARGPLARPGALGRRRRRRRRHAPLRVHADILRQDLRYSAAALGRAPGFALTVVLVAALGVGATTAAFSITDHVLVRPLPFPEPERLVQLWQDPVTPRLLARRAVARQLSATGSA